MCAKLVPAAVVFDAVGTLIHPEPPAAVVYAAVAQQVGSRLSLAEIRVRFRKEFERQEEIDRAAGQRTSEARERQRWRDIVGAVLDDVTDPERCFAELFEHFSRPTAWACTPETRSVLRELAARGHVLDLASNYDRRLQSVVAGMPELQPIQHLIISSEIGYRKPAPEFFIAVCHALQQPPHEILFIGDSLRNDYEGASKAGLRALLFDPQGKASFGVPRIGRLSELLHHAEPRP
ncbi:MAG TPA: HAD-IA family hydrolase [Gemmataceae bacterium]|nr:HAD-IA family hydrolase [Gemmataceae bacterium]